RWIDAPAKAFVNPQDPSNLILGEGKRSDGSWAPIGLHYADLRYVLHITAPMGRGKSEWLRNMFQGLMNANAGCLMLDCKGTDLVNNSLPLVPLSREGDVTILDLGGTTITGEDLRASMNLMSPIFGRSLGLKFSQQASTVLGVFSTLDSKFDEAVGIKQFANMGMLALLEGEPKATMMHLIRFFGDDDYRAEVIGRVNTMQVKDFWDRRFPEMPEGQKTSLASFERRLDQLLTFPELAAMLVAPGCSIDLRKAMDNRGIVLAGIRATEGQIASIAATLLLTQMTLASLSRSNVPEERRPDWPVVIDEAQIVFGQNPGMAPIIFSQLRAFRIGTVVVHQNLDQLSNIMPVLAGNAQNRVILGSEVLDASKYGGDYGALGLTKEDFINMPRFEQQYIKLYGCGNLFASRMLPMAKPLDEGAPPRVYHNWRTVTAPPANSKDKEIDDAIGRFGELAKVRWDEAVQRLGMLCMKSPAAFDAYCARTRAHRLARRQFILDNPGCIRIDPELSEEQGILQQKDDRIRILSALGSGVPKLETEALQWALLMASREAGEVRKQREEAAAEAKKAARKGGSGGGVSSRSSNAKSEASSPVVVDPGAAGANTWDTISLDPPEVERAKRTHLAVIPTMDELMANRGRRRDADDRAPGWES
ncbi:MAG: hypothetical protein M3R24_25090, partial [Chloroflexota bacterium]|nr:hypothetical protein [Chloroflexota bacterium]